VFCEDVGITLISEIDLGVTEKFRQTWSKCTRRLSRKKARTIANLPGIPCKARLDSAELCKVLKRPKTITAPTMPYTIDEMKMLLDTCGTLATKRPKHGHVKL